MFVETVWLCKDYNPHNLLTFNFIKYTHTAHNMYLQLEFLSAGLPLLGIFPKILGFSTRAWDLGKCSWILGNFKLVYKSQFCASYLFLFDIYEPKFVNNCSSDIYFPKFILWTTGEWVSCGMKKFIIVLSDESSMLHCCNKWQLLLRKRAWRAFFVFYLLIEL